MEKRPRYIIRVRLNGRWKLACAMEGNYTLHRLREEAKIMLHCYESADGVKIDKK
jgi:hypothetical protein